MRDPIPIDLLIKIWNTGIIIMARRIIVGRIAIRRRPLEQSGGYKT
jgi:hypothetical protein